MMALGSSHPWEDALEMLTGTRQLSPEPLLEYYKPLYEWLQKQVQEHNIPVGWE